MLSSPFMPRRRSREISKCRFAFASVTAAGISSLVIIRQHHLAQEEKMAQARPGSPTPFASLTSLTESQQEIYLLDVRMHHDHTRLQGIEGCAPSEWALKDLVPVQLTDKALIIHVVRPVGSAPPAPQENAPPPMEVYGELLVGTLESDVRSRLEKARSSIIQTARRGRAERPTG